MQCSSTTRTRGIWLVSARFGWIAPMLAIVALGAGRPASSTPAAAAADTTVITIVTTNAGLAFDPDEIVAKAGSTVMIRYVNESGLSHNLVIMKDAKDIDEVGAASFSSHDSNFVPSQHKAKMVAFSPLATAGKTVEFTFVAPPVGEYPFVCYVDGHFNMMVGKLRSIK